MKTIISDLKRYISPFNNRFEWNEPSYIVLILFRIGSSIRKIKFKPLRILLSVLHTPFYAFFSIFMGISIPRGATIGKGFRIYHFGGIVLNPLTKIGDNCSFHQGVTVGVRNTYIDVPIIGNNVTVGAGAKLLGDIKIGDNVVIGANAVVLCDVPNDSIAVGIPAKVYKKKANISNDENIVTPW
jgi:serine O-acetyltransferase